MSRRRLRGLAWHYLLHALNYLVPLLTIPMLTRMLGPETYGRYGVFLVWAGLIAQLIDFGAGIHSTKQLVARAHDEPQSDRLLARVMLCQAANAVAGIALLVAVAVWSPAIESGGLALVFGALATLAIGLTPLWFFVARVRVGELAAPMIVSRVVSVALVFGVLPLAPGIGVAMLAYLANAAWPFAIAWRIRHRIVEEFRAFRLAAYLGLMRASLPYTVQRMGATLFLNVPAFLVALWFGAAAAGAFVLVDRIVRMTISLMQPLVQQLMPMQIARLHGSADAPPARLVRRFVLVTMAIALGASLSLGLLADIVIGLAGGSAFAAAVPILEILAGQAFVSTMNLIVTNRMYGLNREKRVAATIWVCGIGFLAAAATIGRHSIDAFAACYMGVEVACLLALLAQSRARPVRAAPGG